MLILKSPTSDNRTLRHIPCLEECDDFTYITVYQTRPELDRPSAAHLYYRR